MIVVLKQDPYWLVEYNLEHFQLKSFIKKY